ncbi:hypothetical protein GGF31_008093 [Allomyces arbusculus]|nr:hypothetical protein GGF31_008093 [Allomyces arbusculus]
MPVSNASTSSDDPDLVHDPVPTPAAVPGSRPNPAVAVPSADPPAAGSVLHLPAPALALRPTQSTPSVATSQPATFLLPPAHSGGGDSSSSMPRIVSIDGHAATPGESMRASALLVHAPGADGAADNPVRVRSLSFGMHPRPLVNVSGIIAAHAAAGASLPDVPTSARGTLPAPKPVNSKASAGRAAIQKLRSVLPTNRWEDALFSLAYVTVCDNELPPTTVEDLQLLSFALTSRLHSDAPLIPLAIVEPIRLMHDYSEFQVVNVIALALILLTAVLAFFVAAKVVRSSKVPIATLRLLRLLFTVEMSALSIPIAQLLLAGLNCGSGKVAHYDKLCFGPAHLPLFVMDVIGIIVFAPLMLVASLVFLETSPTSLSPEAKPHGRVDFVIVAARLGFVTLYTFMPETPTGNWLYSVFITLGLLYLIRSVALAQPYYDTRMTAMRLGFMVATLCAMVLSMVAYGTGIAQGWLTMFVPAAIVGFAAGVALAKWSAKWMFAQHVRHWHRISKLEHQAGMGGRISEAAAATGLLEGRTKSGRRFRAATISHLGVPPPSTMARGTVPHSPPSPGSAMGSTVAGWVAAVADTNALTRLMEKTSTEVLDEVKQKKKVMRDRVFSSPLQVEACIRFIRENPTPNQITVGLQLLERGLIEFDDTLLLFVAATYLAAYFGDAGKTAADELIEEIKARPIRFDEKFLIYAKERQEREDDKLGEYGAQGRGLLESAEFQNLDRKSKVAHLLSLYAMREFFETVRIQGSLVQLSNALSKLTQHRSVAIDTYARLLIKFPKSKSVLRSYAQFLISVDGDHFKATQLLTLDMPPLAYSIESPSFPDRDDSTMEPEITYLPLARDGFMLSDSIDVRPASRRGSMAANARRGSMAGNPLHSHPSPPRSRMGSDNIPPPLGEYVTANRATFHVSTKPSLPDYDKSGGRGSVMPNRQQLENRRHLVMRATRSLHQLPAILSIGTVYLAALIAGFIVCVTFFAQSRIVMQVNFTLAKVSRRQIINVIDAIQRILAANYYLQWPRYSSMMAAEFSAAYTVLRAAWTQVTSEALPFLSNDPDASSTLYRIALITNTTIPGVFDYKPDSISLLELVQTIAIAGGTALQFPTLGELTFDRMQGIPAIDFLFENCWTLLTAVSQLPQKGIAAYDVLTASSNAQLIVALVLAIMALLALSVFLYVQPLCGYFGVENKILKHIANINKRAAMELVTATEEEIESFREFTNLDDVTDLDLASQAHITPAGSLNEQNQGSDRRRVTRLILLAVLAVAVLTSGMFTVAFQLRTVLTVTQNVTVLMRLMTQSIERRFYIRVNQLLTRQLMVPGNTQIPNSDNLRTLRSNLYDFKLLHDKLTSDTKGLSAQFPQYTVYLADSAVIAVSATSGGTNYSATIALDAGLSAYIDDADRFISAVNPGATLISAGPPGTQIIATDVGNLSVTLPGPDAPDWIALQARCELLNVQLDLLDAAIADRIMASVSLALTGCIVVFTATVAAVVALATHIHLVVFRKLRDKARALVAVLFLMPQSVTKDAPELANLIKSGGLTLSAKETKES